MDKIEEVAKAVQIKEGYFPISGKYPEGSVSFRCNNPGNILAGALATELKASGSYKSPNGLTYAVFATYEEGFYALKKFLMWGFSGQLKRYKPEMTLAEFFKVYSGGGDTYGQFVADKTGIPVTTQVRYIYDEFWDQAHEASVASGETVPSLEIENQDQQKYDTLYLGKSKSSMRKYGCKLFCLRTLYNFYHGKDAAVTTINDKLYEGGAFFGAGGDMLDDLTAAKVLDLQFLGKETNIDKAPDWSPTIKEVDFSAAAGKQQHFVVRVIKNGKLSILDPWKGVERKVNYYEALTGNADWSKGGFSYREFKNK
jgi:hypothetical protein